MNKQFSPFLQRYFLNITEVICNQTRKYSGIFKQIRQDKGGLNSHPKLVHFIIVGTICYGSSLQPCEAGASPMMEPLHFNKLITHDSRLIAHNPPLVIHKLALITHGAPLQESNADSNQARNSYDSSPNNHPSFFRWGIVLWRLYLTFIFIMTYVIGIYAISIIHDQWNRKGFIIGLGLFTVASALIYHFFYLLMQVGW